MKDKRAKETDDRVLDYLLKDYKRVSLSSEEKEELISSLEAKKAGVPEENFPVFFPAYKFITVAAAVLLLVFGSFLFFHNAPLNNTYSVSTEGQELIKDKTGSYTAPGDSEILILSETEKVVMSPGTEMRIKGTPFRRITGDAVNVYELAEGDLYIEHYEGSFMLETEYGVFSPVGTIISCSSRADEINLYCVDGRMKITPVDGEEFFLDEGFVLSCNKDDGTWSHIIGKMSESERFYQPEDIPVGPRPKKPESQPPAVSPPQDVSKPDIADAEHWQLSWKIRLQGIKTASVKEDRLYLLGNERLTVVDSRSGSVLSAMDGADKYKFSDLYENILLGFTGNTFEAVDADTSEIIWSIGNAPVIYSGFSTFNGMVYLPSVDGNLYIYRLESGEEEGVIKHGAGLYGIPAVEKDILIFSSIDKKISGYGAMDKRRLWEMKTEERLLGDRPVFSYDKSAVLNYDEEGKLFMLDISGGTITAETEYVPPMAIPPLPSGEYFIFQDAEGIRIADGKSLEFIETIKTERLYGVGMTGRFPVFITDRGIFRIEDGTFKNMEKNTTGGAVEDGSVLVTVPDGNMEKWEYK